MAPIKKLVSEAHQIFDQTSVFEVIDRDRSSAVAFLNEAYKFPHPESINRYLEVLSRLKLLVG